MFCTPNLLALPFHPTNVRYESAHAILPTSSKQYIQPSHKPSSVYPCNCLRSTFRRSTTLLQSALCWGPDHELLIPRLFVLLKQSRPRLLLSRLLRFRRRSPLIPLTDLTLPHSHCSFEVFLLCLTASACAFVVVNPFVLTFRRVVIDEVVILFEFPFASKRDVLNALSDV